MSRLRLLADDLTGALDAAAAFVPLLGPIPCRWDAIALHGGTAVLDMGTRELSAPAAAARFAACAPALEGADIAFLKIDSLLRGHGLADLAAALRDGPWRRALLAPAFPAQGRITRDGHQFARGSDGAWAPVGPDLVAALQAQGVDAQRAGPDLVPAPGVTVCDAQSEADLIRIVAQGRQWEGPILWCGSGGLAEAMAAGAPAVPVAPLRGPILGLFGSDQPATAAQLAACGPWYLPLPAGAPDAVEKVAAHMARTGGALVSFTLPAGMPRAAAAAAIRTAVSDLVGHLPPPRTLLAAGGETLRAICDAVGADHLELTGALLPGVPRSRVRGGAWDGTTIISKSGAFGAPDLLRRLLNDAPFAVERIGS